MTQEELDQPAVQEIIEIVLRFCNLISGKNLYSYQREIAAAIIAHVCNQSMESLTVLLSRQSGKSTVIGDMTAGLLIILPQLAQIYGDQVKTWNEDLQVYEYPLRRFTPNYKGIGTGGLRVGVYAPSEDQSLGIFNMVRNILESENTKKILRDMDITIETSRGDTFSMSNGSRIMCKTASEGTQLVGATHDLLLVDEAQDTSTKVIVNGLRPMLANTGGNMVYIGTCGYFLWDFYDTIQANKNLESQDGIRRNFEYDYTHCSNENFNYKKYVEREIAKYGFDSDFVKMNYRLIWSTERGYFITHDMMYGQGEYLTKPILDPLADFIYLEHKKPCYVGIDFGKVNDSTVVTVLSMDNKPIQSPDGTHYIKRLLAWLEIHGDNYESQYWQITHFLQNYNVKTMYLDATQHDPIADRFATYLSGVEVVPFKASQSGNSDMFKTVSQEIHAGRIKIPYSPQVQETQILKKAIHQLLNLEKSWRQQFLHVGHPKIAGAHDDFFSSLCLAIMATMNDDMGEVEVWSESNIFVQDRGVIKRYNNPFANILG